LNCIHIPARQEYLQPHTYDMMQKLGGRGGFAGEFNLFGSTAVVIRRPLGGGKIPSSVAK